MDRGRNLIITTMFVIVVWLLLMLCDATRTDRINVPTAKGQNMLVDGRVADISPGNIFKFLKTNCNMKLLWSSVTTMEQRDGVSSSTSLNQELLSRRILRKSPPVSYPPPGHVPSIVPAPAPGPIAGY